jgi:hypothetical protein
VGSRGSHRPANGNHLTAPSEEKPKQNLAALLT